MTKFHGISICTFALFLFGNAIADTEEPVTPPQTAEFVGDQDILPSRAPHAGVNANLFRGHSWYTPPPAPVSRPRPAPVERKPVAPPLPFELLGSYEQDGSPTTFYLVKGDRVYDVIVGDTLDDTYTVDSVSGGKLMFTYLPLKTSQGLRLGEQK